MKLILSSLFLLAFGAAFAQDSFFVNDPKLPVSDTSVVQDIINPDKKSEGSSDDQSLRIVKNPAIAPPVPEPATMLALGAAGALFAARARRRK